MLSTNKNGQKRPYVHWKRKVQAQINSLENVNAEEIKREHIGELKNKLSRTTGVLKGEYRAACHICKPTKYFKTLDECQEHVRKDHRIWKG